MRAVLPLALVFALAGGVEAQEAPQHAEQTVQAVQQLDGPRSPETAPTVRAPKVPIQAAPAEGADEAGAPVVQNELQTRAVEAMDARQGPPGTMNWWWLVAAIVVAGLIIVALT
jgi:hypothetical protein